eukprot:scaffold11836_cov74-Phaeocystis_antarctica.AAC.3
MARARGAAAKFSSGSKPACASASCQCGAGTSIWPDHDCSASKWSDFASAINRTVSATVNECASRSSSPCRPATDAQRRIWEGFTVGVRVRVRGRARGRVRGWPRAVDLRPWSGFEGRCSHALPGCGTSARASVRRRQDARTPRRSRPRALTR